MTEALRQLTPTQQVAALFVVLFGLLFVAGTAAFLLSLRERRHPEQDTRWPQELAHLRQLLGTSFFMVAVFWIAWALGEGMATLLFALLSFFALREFITLSPTRRGDHRNLVLAFFLVLPVQYWLVYTRRFDLFTVFVPVYAFFAMPVASALADDPAHFLERNAKLQWGIMVCVFGLSHVPALLLLNFPGFDGKSAFLVLHLVLVVQTGVLVQHLIARWSMARAGRASGADLGDGARDEPRASSLSARGLRALRERRPVAPHVSRSFNWSDWLAGTTIASLVGASMAFITPFSFAQALVVSLVACVAGSLGRLVTKALKRDLGIPHWGPREVGVTGANGLLDRIDALCFAAPVFFHSVRWYFSA